MLGMDCLFRPYLRASTPQGAYTMYEIMMKIDVSVTGNVSVQGCSAPVEIADIIDCMLRPFPSIETALDLWSLGHLGNATSIVSTINEWEFPHHTLSFYSQSHWLK